MNIKSLKTCIVTKTATMARLLQVAYCLTAIQTVSRLMEIKTTTGTINNSQLTPITIPTLQTTLQVLKTCISHLQQPDLLQQENRQQQGLLQLYSQAHLTILPPKIQKHTKTHLSDRLKCLISVQLTSQRAMWSRKDYARRFWRIFPTESFIWKGN